MLSEDDYEDAIDARLPCKTDADLLALIRLTDEAIEAHPTSSEFLRVRAAAECALTHGDILEAKAFLDRAYALAPYDAETLSELGYWHDVYRDGETKVAFGYFADSIRHGGDAEAWYGLVRCALQRGRVSFSSRAISRMEALFPGDPMTIDARRESESGIWFP